MTSDDDLLLLLKFVLFRFVGTMPSDKMLINAIHDWRKQPTNDNHKE